MSVLSRRATRMPRASAEELQRHVQNPALDLISVGLQNNTTLPGTETPSCGERPGDQLDGKCQAWFRVAAVSLPKVK